MLKWLHRFFYSDDSVVKLASGFSEPEALMYKELIENNGIPAMVKNMNFLSVTKEFGSTPGDYDLFVKQSDVERAQGVLDDLLRDGQLTRGARRRRKGGR